MTVFIVKFAFISFLLFVKSFKKIKKTQHFVSSSYKNKQNQPQLEYILFQVIRTKQCASKHLGNFTVQALLSNNQKQDLAELDVILSFSLFPNKFILFATFFIKYIFLKQQTIHFRCKTITFQKAKNFKLNFFLL